MRTFRNGSETRLPIGRVNFTPFLRALRALRKSGLILNHMVRISTFPSLLLYKLLFGAGGKSKGQDAFHLDGDAIESRRFVDPLARRVNCRVAQRRVSAD